MLNLWKPYPKKRPNKSGWYLCSIRFKNGSRDQEYVMDLYYDARTDRWKDNRRINVFQLYTVVGLSGQQLFADNTCIRDDVVAFKKLPHIYRWGRPIFKKRG